MENRLGEWRRLLRQSTTQGRAVLQRVLRGRLTFWPSADGRSYEFAGPTRFDKLFTGIATPVPAWMEPDPEAIRNIDPGDCLPDRDYERLLEAAERSLNSAPRTAVKA